MTLSLCPTARTYWPPNRTTQLNFVRRPNRNTIPISEFRQSQIFDYKSAVTIQYWQILVHGYCNSMCLYFSFQIQLALMITSSLIKCTCFSSSNSLCVFGATVGFPVTGPRKPWVRSPLFPPQKKKPPILVSCLSFRAPRLFFIMHGVWHDVINGGNFCESNRIRVIVAKKF